MSEHNWWQQGAKPVESDGSGGDWWKVGAKEVEDPNADGSATRGFKTAMRQIPQTIGGTIGLVGDAIGSEGMRDYGMGVYKKQSDEIQKLSRDSDSFSKVLEGEADPVEFAKYAAGYTGGQALTALGTGGVGGLVGRKVAEKGLERAVARGAAELATEEAAKQAAKRGAMAGAGAAAYGSNLTQEAGSIYPEAVEQAQKDGRLQVDGGLSGADLARVAGSAAVAAGVDTAMEAKMLKGALGGASTASTLAGRAVREIPKAMGREAVTEGIQTGIERFGAQQSLGDQEAIRDYVDSAALGAVGGGLGGAAGSIRQSGAAAPAADAGAAPGDGLALAPLEQTAPAAAPAGEPLPAVDGAAAVQRTFDPRDPNSRPPMQTLPTAPTDGLTFEASEEPAAREIDTGDLRLQEEGPFPALPAPTITVDAQGNAQTAADRTAAREVPVPPSQRMGLDANAGPLSAAAVAAVDGGAHQEMLARQAEAAAQAQAAEAAKGKKPPAPSAPAAAPAVNAETGELFTSPQDRISELQARLQFVRQQAAANGWDQRLVAERDRTLEELQALAVAPPAPAAAPAARPTSVREGIAQARARRAERPTITDSATQPPGEVSGPQADEAQQIEAQQSQAGGAAPAGRAAQPAGAAAAPAGAGGLEASGLNPQVADLQRQLREVEGKILAAAPDALGAGGGDIEVAARSRKVPVPLKAQRKRLKAQIAEALRAASTQAEGDGLGQRASAPAEVPAGEKIPVGISEAAATREASAGAPEAEQIPVAKAEKISAAANEAATSPLNDKPEPTEAQKRAGNYSLGHLSGPDVQGLRISIENPQGSTRSGTSPDGRSWRNTMQAHYGYVKGSEAADGDHVDVFVGPHAATAPTVYVVDQINPDGTYDEAKALFGFASEVEAVAAYKGSYDADWRVGPVTAMSVDEFKAGLEAGRFKKPLDPKLATARQPDGAPRAKPARGVAGKVQEAKAKRESKAARAAREAEQARAAYFTPGNVVRGYGGSFDRVVAYHPPTEPGGRWSVDVAEVRKTGPAAFEDTPDARVRSHSTEPSARELRAGPAGTMSERAEAMGDVPFRRSDLPFSTAAIAQAVQSVSRTSEAIRSKWANGPDVIVAFDMNDPVIPEAVRAADQKQRSGGASGDPEGFYYRGKAYLIASQLKSENDVARVLFHEVLGHHGLRSLFGKDLGSILDQIVTMRRAEVEAKARDYGLRGVSFRDTRIAAEEVLAEMAQNTPDLHFVQRAIAAIRTWLRQNVPGFKNMRMSDDEIVRNFILPARAFVERGLTGQRGAGASVTGFSRSADTAAAYESRIDALLAGDKPKPQGVRVLDRSDVLGLLGMGEGPVHLVESKVEKGQFSHGLTAADWKSVPNWLENPIAVFESETSPGRLVFIAPETVRGSPVRMIVDPRADGKGVNLLINAYDAERNPFDRWERDGLLRYVDVKKTTPASQSFQPRLAGLQGEQGPTPQIWRRGGGQFPKQAALSQGRQRILTERHLAGYRRANADGAEGTAPPVFSRSTVQAFTKRATAELNKTFSVPGKLSWWHKTVGTMYNLAERSPAFKAVFDAAQGFVDDVSYYATDAADLAPKLLPKLETWRDIKKAPVSAADNKAVAKPVFEGTLTWARDESGKPVPVQQLIDAAVDLSADQKAQRLLRNGHLTEQMLKAWKGMPLESYEKAVGTRFESKMLTPGVVWTDAELRSMFGLTDGQIALYREFREATDRSLDTMARADMLRFVGDDAKGLRDMVMDAPDAQAAAVLLRDHLVQTASEQPDRATHLLNIANGVIDRADKVRDLQARGYAPLSRFGRYTVDVVDAEGERQYFGLFETMREANQMAARMKEEFGEGAVSQGTLSEEAFKLFAGVTPETLELFGNALGLDSTGDSAQDQAFQEYLRLTKTNRSAMRRLIHRKGIAGFSEDVGRVLAAFVYSNARQTAAGLHMGDLGEAVNAIPKEQGELKDAAVRLAEYVKNPQEEAQAVRGLLFAQYLGGSVASAFVNMSQPVAVTFPWLSQYGGAKAAAAQIGRAAKDMANRGRKIEPDLAAALKRAEAEGVVAPQEVHQLMAQARGAGSLRSGDGTRAGDLRALGQNALSRLSLAWGKVFGAAEQVNRRLTFIAAYRTAKERGMADPAEFARKAITETQFLYSKANKMEWGRGAIGGTLMTFKTYSVAYLELLHRMWTQGGPEGKRATMLALGMLMLMGGAGGLPFEEDLEDAVDALAQMLGYNFSTKKARQEFLEIFLPRGIAQFIDKGVSGLPGAPLDVSGRLGMGNLIPGTGLLLEKTSHARDVLEIAGPAGDFASRILSGGKQILTGNVGRGLLEISPTAVRNAAKGVDMAATGMYRDAKGYKVLDTNVLEAAMKSIGFQPASVATVQEANSINQGAKAFYNLRAQEIRAQWAQGIFEGDQAKVQAARDAVAEWNRKNPEQRMIVSIPSVMHKVREMRKSKDQRIADTAPKAMRTQMREDIARTRAELAG